VQYLEGCVKEWKRQNKQLRLVVEEQAMAPPLPPYVCLFALSQPLKMLVAFLQG
jgi:hypothetical protein